MIQSSGVLDIQLRVLRYLTLTRILKAANRGSSAIKPWAYPEETPDADDIPI